MKKFNAFTLAEVLITLGIIGVVAAMTIPTLINRTNGVEYKTAFKKGLSVISQAVTLNKAIDDEDFSTLGNANATSVEDMLKNRTNVLASGDGKDIYGTNDTDGVDFDVKITPCTEFNTDGSCKTEGAEVAPDTFVTFNDGIVFAYLSTATNCTQNAPCSGLIDANGPKKPNTLTTSADDPKDIYTVTYYDNVVLPGDEAARNVLYKK